MPYVVLRAPTVRPRGRPAHRRPARADGLHQPWPRARPTRPRPRPRRAGAAPRPRAPPAHGDHDAARAAQGRSCPSAAARCCPSTAIVAYYGNGQSKALGVLGHYTPDQAAVAGRRRGREVGHADETGAGGARAHRDARRRLQGHDGNYSHDSTPEQIQPYLDAARKNHELLILDIQPGRQNFLPVVKRYEKFLLKPDVGVALDSEWRMGPDQIPAKSCAATSPLPRSTRHGLPVQADRLARPAAEGRGAAQLHPADDPRPGQRQARGPASRSSGTSTATATATTSCSATTCSRSRSRSSTASSCS